MDIEERIRCGSIVTESQPDNKGNKTFCRTFFIGEDFFVYRFVKKGIGYRGRKYPEDGYALVFADRTSRDFIWMPAFVSKYPKGMVDTITIENYCDEHGKIVKKQSVVSLDVKPKTKRDGTTEMILKKID